MTAVGVFNPNWRGAEMREYVRSLSEPQPDPECSEIIKAIRPFFDDEMWEAWRVAGPNDNAGFLNYARAEWRNIYYEFMIPDKFKAEDADWLDEQATRESVRP